MIHVSIRCYAELNDSLRPHQRFTAFPLTLASNSTLDEVISTIGISPRIIDLILVNGNSKKLEYCPIENDQISLYPMFETFDISALTKVHNKPLRNPKFVLDVHLGKLARYLRLLGFDTFYKNNYSPCSLIEISLKENRILLSRNKSLIADERLTHGYSVTNEEPIDQLKEILRRMDLYSLADPFTRCIVCNSLLKIVDKESILSSIPKLVLDFFNEFCKCTICGRIYWKGSHYQRMTAFIKDILNTNVYRNN